ncbi:Tn3 family transposase [Listeria riparia]|uniref:Transposase X n=1 Tax=Listeria riparia FSL S10-1204 TaxID=1265816 RepID=W7CZI1_9LIST|nr:Tn3 family transposase [Listeria riparia]EUJ42337.1 transposase X [Listeria riparia FSL S10-1204]
MVRIKLLTDYQRKKCSYFISDNLDGQELLARYFFDKQELAFIATQRSAANRLGIALQMAFMKYPGYPFQNISEIPERLLSFIANQISVQPNLICDYKIQTTTGDSHISRVKKLYKLESFSLTHYKKLSHWLFEHAWGTDQGDLLFEILLSEVRRRKIILPAISTLEELVRGARYRARSQSVKALTNELEATHIQQFQAFFHLKDETSITWLSWLRQRPSRTSIKQLISTLNKIQFIRQLDLPAQIAQNIHPNRLAKLSQDALSYTPQQLSKKKEPEKWAFLVALVSHIHATLIDEAVDRAIHIVNRMRNQDQRWLKETLYEHKTDIVTAAQLYAEIGQRLIDARNQQQDPYEAISHVLPWDDYEKSVLETNQLFEKRIDTDPLALIVRHYNTLRRFFPLLLECLHFVPTAVTHDLFEAVEYLQHINREKIKKLKDPPIDFVKSKWESWIFQSDETPIHRRYYEFHLFFELCHALRSGDMHITSSKQYQDLEAYLYPQHLWNKTENKLLHVPQSVESFLEQMTHHTKYAIQELEQLIRGQSIPELKIDGDRIILSPLQNVVPEEAKHLSRRIYRKMPKIRLTELIEDVTHWTQMQHHFCHTHTKASVKESLLLYTSILSDGINLGLHKMAQACPNVNYNQLSWFYLHYISEENYLSALGSLADYQATHPFATHWGNATTSSSDGQFYRTTGQSTTLARPSGKHQEKSGLLIYTHVNDQYSPYYAQLISASEEAAHIIDGLLYHQSDTTSIQQHFTDAAGYTFQVFGLCHLLGIRFSTRIKKINKKSFYSLMKCDANSPLSSLYAGKVNTAIIRECWDDLLRLSYSVQTRVVTASSILKKLSSYPRQNHLALALRELGKIFCGLHLLEWIGKVDVRQTTQLALNKGEAENALKRALRLQDGGGISAKTFENQIHRTYGTNTLISMIIIWNTTYIQEIVHTLRMEGEIIPEELLKHVSPLGWSHINFTGDYVWKPKRKDFPIGAIRAIRPDK